MQHARLFLEGRHRELEAALRERMKEASDDLEFERAARHRDILRTIEKLAVLQHLASVGLEEQDYFAHHAEGGQAALQLFQMREGKVQARREFTFDEIDFEPASFYASVLAQYYADQEPPREIYLPDRPADAELLERWLAERRGGKVAIKLPERGVKKRILELVRKNAQLAPAGTRCSTLHSPTFTAKP